MISFAAVFVRLADVAPTTSGFYRMVFGSIALLVLIAARPRLHAGFGRGWAGSALIAAFFTADMWFWHRSILFIGPGLSTLLANFQVFVLAAIGVLWFRERVGARFAADDDASPAVVRELEGEPAGRYGLTNDQYEVLAEAARMGYFEVPRAASQADVAAELGITASSLSERLRRAQAYLAETTLAQAALSEP